MADFLLPNQVKDFVFDMHDSCRRSMIAEDQKSLYTQQYRELTQKYFATSEWPPADAVKDECESDRLFLAFYEELVMRHKFGTQNIRVTLKDKIASWRTYSNLFEMVWESTNIDMLILPEWIFEIMHEFVYQFQGFCQYRTKEKSRTEEEKEMLTTPSGKEPWSVIDVMYTLHRLIDVSNIKNPNVKAPSKVHETFGHFAAVSLSRLECLLGDYHASLQALDNFDLFDKKEMFHTVFSARLNVYYHTGISYFALRRYNDCVSVFQTMCSDINRGMKTGVLRQLSGFDQFDKLHQKMIALIAIVSHICPSVRINDSLKKFINDKYGEKLAKIQAGEDGYEELFTFACPKFISPVIPDYENQTSNLCQDAYRHLVSTFVNDIQQQVQLPKMRSYLKLYSSIGIDKLAAFNDVDSDEFLARLVCFKHKSFQTLKKEGGSPLEGEKTNVADVFYFIKGDTVVVDEQEKKHPHDKFFVNNILNCRDIALDVDRIPGSV